MELLIQTNVDPVKPTAHPVGDVIWFHDDNHRFGLSEATHPNWRIVRVPGLTLAEAESLVAPQLPTKLGQTNLALRGLTVDVVPLGLIAAPRDTQRGRLSHVEFIIDHVTFMSFVSIKPTS